MINKAGNTTTTSHPPRLAKKNCIRPNRGFLYNTFPITLLYSAIAKSGLKLISPLVL